MDTQNTQHWHASLVSFPAHETNEQHLQSSQSPNEREKKEIKQKRLTYLSCAQSINAHAIKKGGTT
jgi:hypothetical protein